MGNYEQITVQIIFIVSDIQADFTVLLDIDPAIGLERIKSRGQTDRIEQESMDFFYRIAKAYRKKAQSEEHKYAIIDASQTISEVKTDIIAAFEEFKEKLL